jgi:antitoxin (DNA-binding transcriptional repressor) of toxin-antitoxin stability system
MTCVGIREFKGHVTRYVDLAYGGEEVTITKWGMTMARLVGEPRRERGLRDQLASLAAEGLIALPSIRRNPRFPRPITVKGTPASQIILEDRR